jgi:asparagine synthase (glutamine-hydrolysing)
MCGIAGLITPAPSPHAAQTLRAMARRIAHRGPDDEGFFETSTSNGRHRVGLAHRRLAIIDLATGHQPMGNEDGRVQIVFNGEIYNFAGLRDELIALGHRFATASDTETIVHAWEQWGPDCVQRFAGMFALAIWDANQDTLFLARDRFGKKPLFIAEHGGSLLFASEIKALLAWPGLPRELDRDGLWDYFERRYVPAPRTLWRGVRKLMPGHWLRWQRGALRETRYWSPPDALAYAAAPLPADPVGRFLDELDRAVRMRMVSDVPYGAFLSGGIDSSAIVALMSRHSSQPVKTFSVGFAESDYSELGYAKQIADRFATEHHELEVSAAHLVDHLPAMARFRDAPVAETADVPIYLLSVEAGKTVKMVLSGEGSDELLAGYPKHRFERYARAWQRVPRPLRRSLIEPLVQALPWRFWRAQTVAATLGIEPFEARMKRWFGAMTREECAALLQLAPPRLAPFVGPVADPRASALRRILHFDQTSWLPDNLLERGDRMTMAASIEARMPYMDHELAAYVSSLPDRYRLRGMTSKWILRQAMQRVLPKAILERPKVGFRLPVNLWFRGPLRDYLRESLTGPSSLTSGYYRTHALRRVLDEHDRGRCNHEKLLWCLLNLEVWQRECMAAAPVHGPAVSAEGSAADSTATGEKAFR